MLKSGTKGGEKVETVAEIAEIKERRHKMGFYQGREWILQKYKTINLRCVKLEVCESTKLGHSFKGAAFGL